MWALKISFLVLIFTITISAQQQWFWQNPLPQGHNLYDVKFIDENNGWAVGGYGSILKTTDGGVHWNVNSNSTSVTLYGISIFDNSFGLAVGLNGTILKTTDGGENWINQTSGITNILNSVQVIDENTSYA